MTRLTLLVWLGHLSVRVTCTLSRAIVREVARQGRVVVGWSDGKLVTEPARRDMDLPDAEWPECTVLNTGMVMGSGGWRAEA